MPVKDYRDDLLTRLSNSEYAAHYLKAALDETLGDGDRDAFLLALKNILEAREGLQDASSDANISTARLRTVLDETESPTIETLISVLRAARLTMEFKSAPSQL
ncbi:MAG: hypothetical protein WBA57_00225 [Elainellaceae cyanobacterium]